MVCLKISIFFSFYVVYFSSVKLTLSANSQNSDQVNENTKNTTGTVFNRRLRNPFCFGLFGKSLLVISDNGNVM